MGLAMAETAPNFVYLRFVIFTARADNPTTKGSLSPLPPQGDCVCGGVSVITSHTQRLFYSIV